MSCFYCGKRVSLVRKRVDADFCCEDHREKYHARARRTIETLREADEQIAATRRLSEGLHLPNQGPKHGKQLSELMVVNPGQPLQFGWVPTGLPASHASLDIHIPAAGLREFRAGTASVSPQARTEKIRWSLGHVQQTPRPPRVFKIVIQLP